MYKHIILIFLLFTLSTLCHALDIEKDKWYNFAGNLGDNSIHLSLYRFDDGVLKGNYCYTQNESKIYLEGQIIGDKIELTEFLNGKLNGRFEGRLSTENTDQFTGTWTDMSNTKSVAFTLKLSSICGGKYEHRYMDFYGTDDDVENFMKRVKSSILSGDKEWIANHIHYPLKTTLNKNKTIIIKTKKQLIANFDQIFHQEFKDKMKSFCVCNMFNNDNGVMLGDGQIWIYNKPNSTEEKFDYHIRAISND